MCMRDQRRCAECRPRRLRRDVNRNFEDARAKAVARTWRSPAMAAAAALSGRLADDSASGSIEGPCVAAVHAVLRSGRAIGARQHRHRSHHPVALSAQTAQQRIWPIPVSRSAVRRGTAREARVHIECAATVPPPRERFSSVMSISVCGSARAKSAVYALVLGFGIRAVVAPRFSDIFTTKLPAERDRGGHVAAQMPSRPGARRSRHVRAPRIAIVCRSNNV